MGAAIYDSSRVEAASSGWLTWPGILRLGLVQTALGAIVVLTTSTINRVMVVELSLPAMLPGALVGWHYALQMLRPRWGYGTDRGRRSTPWIIGGMAVLALGGALTAASIGLMAAAFWPGLMMALLSFTLIGVGVGAAGTSLLVLLARRVAPERKAAAATTVWLMMIAGFAVTAITAGHFLDPYSHERLLFVASAISVCAFLLAVAAVWGVEESVSVGAVTPEKGKDDFRAAVRAVWAEPQARLFSIFVFVSMLAYASQDLILEPFAGAIFAMTPGGSTKLSGIQHGGVLVGMIVVAVACRLLGHSRMGSPVLWTVGGCLASALAMVGLVAAGAVGGDWPLTANVAFLGMANGIYAGAAIGSMMTLATSGRTGREGTRMGVWGAAQAVAFGLGGFLGTVTVDLTRYALGSPLVAYTSVFALEAVLFLVSAILATRVARLEAPAVRQSDERLLRDDDHFALAAGR